MTVFIVTIHVIACFVLILVILLQAGRGSGLSWGSFGGSPQSFLGTKSASFLAKATSVCAILFLITCISLDIIDSRKAKSLFATTRQNQKIDIDKIKKVLEQVKSETPKTPDASKTAAATPTDSKPPASTQPSDATPPSKTPS